MTEVSSTGDAAGAGSSAGSRRSSVPAPPRPPAPLHDDTVGDTVGADRLGEGPATSAMPSLPAVDDETGYLIGSSYTRTSPPVPPLPTGVVPPPKPVRKDRRPQVTVRGPRRAKLVVRRVDPWSVLKFSFLFSVCLLIMWVVAASALLSLLRTMHVFDNINSVLASATSSDPQHKGFRVDPTMHDVRLWAAIIGAVNALLFTALATLCAFLYNLISMSVGGVEVTLAERD
ncbi:MAG: hypothetical protein QOI76_593 [Frankiales bacterium]|nr:hypothetical protein [Frankiales bacterium]